MVLVSEMGRAAHGRSSSRTARHKIANVRASLWIAMVSFGLHGGAAAAGVRIVGLVASNLRWFAEGFANCGSGLMEKRRVPFHFYLASLE